MAERESITVTTHVLYLIREDGVFSPRFGSGEKASEAFEAAATPKFLYEYQQDGTIRLVRRDVR